jgi:hypothetical protein
MDARETESGAISGEDRRNSRDQVRDLLVATLFVAIGTTIAVTAWRAPEPFRSVDILGPNRFPFYVGTGIALFALFVIVKQGFHLVRGTFQEGAFEIPGQANDEPGKPASGTRAAAMMAILLFHVFLWEPLGFLLASVLFVVSAMRLMLESSWRLTVGTAVGYALVTYILFGLLLNVALPLGPEEQLFIRIGLVESVR